jgi:sugar-specific transcriptional regulator TrmB
MAETSRAHYSAGLTSAFCCAKKLEQFGVPGNMARIYTALLEKREMSALEIHESTGVPRSKVYEIAQKMIQRGMCIKKSFGRSWKYQAVEPRRVIDHLIMEDRAKHSRKMKTIGVMTSVFSELYKQGLQSTGSSDYIEIIRDPVSIHRRYLSLLENSNKGVLGFVKPPFSHQNSNKMLEEQEAVEGALLARGVVVKALYEYHLTNLDLLEQQHIERCISTGERARYAASLPVKMYIFDGRFVLISMTNRDTVKSPFTMLVVEHPAWAEAACILFNHLWNNAASLEELKTDFLKGRGIDRVYCCKSEREIPRHTYRQYREESVSDDST